MRESAPSPETLAPAPAEAPITTERAAVPAWAISGITHGAILFVFSLVVFLTREKPDEAPLIPLTQMEPPPIEQRTIPPEHPQPTVATVSIDVPPDKPVGDVPVDIDVPSDEVSATDDGGEEDRATGQDALADMAMDSNAFSMAIGVGSGDKGLFGPRGRGRGPRRFKIGWPQPPIEVTTQVERALKWFKRHQSVDGHWAVAGYQDNCTDGGPKCEPGQEHADASGDIACTAYALMCFNSDGYDHRTPNRFRQTVARAVDWLVATQKADGLWGERNYEHAIATLALAEAYAMTNDPKLREPVQKGVDIICARQTKEANGGYGLGWDYVAPNPSRIDASVSGWNVMALKSAKAAGLDTHDALAGAENWLKKAWQASNPDWKKLDPYKDTSSFAYTWDSTSGKVDVAQPGADEHDMAPVAAVCAVFLHHQAGDQMLETLCNHIEKYQQPTGWPMNTYYLYYNSMALFQAGAARFDRWVKAVPPMLLAAQRKDGCYDGSWDFTGTKFPGHRTGRLLSTAYCCLTLQVFWKYDLVNAPAKAAPRRSR